VGDTPVARGGGTGPLSLVGDLYENSKKKLH